MSSRLVNTKCIPLGRLGLVVVAIVLETSSHGWDFGVDPLSPEIPARSPSDIFDASGANVLCRSVDLGLGPDDNIDAMSYGSDQLTPLGPVNFAQVWYSVTRESVGERTNPWPGAGAVWWQTSGPGANGAAGDKFYLTAVLIQNLGVIPIARGLWSDAPMHRLTPRGSAAIESDLDQLSGPASNICRYPIYFSVDNSTATRHNWHPADIIVAERDSSQQVVLTVWASRTDLRLEPNEDIDALAVRNRGTASALDGGDVVWASLRGDPRVLEVFPSRPRRTVFEATHVNLNRTDDLNALMGIDPGLGDEDEKGHEPLPNFPKIESTARILQSPANLEVRVATLHELCLQLGRDAKLKCVISGNRKAPSETISINKSQSPLGQVLNEALLQIGWTYEIEGDGGLLFKKSVPGCLDESLHTED